MAYDMAVSIAEDWSISFDQIVCVIKNGSAYNIAFEQFVDDCDIITVFFGGERIQ